MKDLPKHRRYDYLIKKLAALYAKKGGTGTIATRHIGELLENLGEPLPRKKPKRDKG